jgi:hypothetical protein
MTRSRSTSTSYGMPARRAVCAGLSRIAANPVTSARRNLEGRDWRTLGRDSVANQLSRAYDPATFSSRRADSAGGRRAASARSRMHAVARSAFVDRPSQAAIGDFCGYRASSRRPSAQMMTSPARVGLQPMTAAHATRTGDHPPTMSSPSSSATNSGRSTRAHIAHAIAANARPNRTVTSRPKWLMPTTIMKPATMVSSISTQIAVLSNRLARQTTMPPPSPSDTAQMSLARPLKDRPTACEGRLRPVANGRDAADIPVIVTNQPVVVADIAAPFRRLTPSLYGFVGAGRDMSAPEQAVARHGVAAANRFSAARMQLQ